MTFLKLVELQQCTADGTAMAIKSSLTDFNLDLDNVKGIGADKASAMMRINNGVYHILKREGLYLILIKCVCYSVKLITSAATAECLPRTLDFLVSET